MAISLKIVSSAGYSNTPPCYEYLEEKINTLLLDGYTFHGSPFWAETSCKDYPVFYQAMIKEIQ